MAAAPKFNEAMKNVACCDHGSTGTSFNSLPNQIADEEGVREYIEHIDFVLFKEKLIARDGLSAGNADAAELKYKKWLFLRYRNPNIPLPPSGDIDIFWHGHILDTAQYLRDTHAIFGYYLHHYPYFGMRGASDKEKLREAFESTQGAWRELYGEEIDAELPDWL